jgi:hypothetical protein
MNNTSYKKFLFYPSTLLHFNPSFFTPWPPEAKKNGGFGPGELFDIFFYLWYMCSIDSALEEKNSDIKK